ncbi:MAG: DNA mismatch repair protein MutS [Acidobacteriota bacterium]|nr:MAG: DNA mismatch repair protein MutS [Acidobacteriota bacterium]
MTKPDPASEYNRRIADRGRSLEEEERIDRRIWLWRRIVFALIAIVIVLAIERVLPVWAPGLPVIAFIWLMAIHQRVQRRLERLRRSVRFYERGLSRLGDNWAGGGETGERFADKHHPYSEDLDLFGEGSLFELLSTARTRAGEEKLAGWLLEPAPIGTIKARQQAVDELRTKLDLREDIALLGSDIRSGIHHEELIAWSAAPPLLTSRLIPILAGLIGAFALVSVVLWLGFGYRQLALAGLLLIMLFMFRYRNQVSRIISDVERPSRDLFLLAEILGRIEKEQFESEALIGLRSALESEGHPPSQQISRLARLTQILDSTRNQFFAPIAFLLLIHAQLAWAIDRWRLKSGKRIGAWLEAIAEIEALDALASYAFEHPHDPFPELVEGNIQFEAEEIGHPLIPESRSIRNDVRLGAETRVLIVSGSNMSGKSTLMRTVGVNAVLAQAGAPVRAKSLKLSPLAVGASIHILDSLQTGASRFYAEITRLRQIIDLTTGELPVLFLLDEILSGTNSHDRRIGAEAVVRGLVERGAVGIVTTHDLALTRIDASIGAVNVHFEDQLEDGRIVFDYRMRPGIVTRSNALELMRSVGLLVESRK